MLKSLSYYYAILKNPVARDFINMGYGINARYKRSGHYWEKHLNLCKSFQEKALKEAFGGRIAVLGAGPLLDINTGLLEAKFSAIDLYDANTSLKKTWEETAEKTSANYYFHFKDVTGTIDVWTNDLTEMLKNKASSTGLIDFFTGLAPQTAKIFNANPDVIFSVNLLSQIPIYWRDRVHKAIKKFTGLDTDSNGNYEPALQAALEKSMRELQAQHLNLISNSGARLVILISDSEFLYYMKSQSSWQSEKALYTESNITLSGYTNYLSDSWFWHIAPQDIEQKNHGCIHNVKAGAYIINS